MKIVYGVREDDADAIMDALWAAYPVVRREHTEAELLDFAVIAGEYLEGEKRTRDATDAWMIAVQLSRASGASEVEERAAKQARKLIGK